ncbi:MAG TPA: DUF885 family protein [Thermoanaerobaculia bacterium]|nr:DUF885 family protein [Thermoanaerobaculia bacterium]
MRRFLPWGVLGVSLAISAGAATPPAGDVEARRKAFQSLLAEQWEYTLSHSPEFASILGDKRWNDKVSDFSQKAIDDDLAKTREFLGRFEAIDPTGFPDQEALTRTLLVRAFKEELDNAHFKNWEMPVSQIGGIHLGAAQLVTLLPFDSVKDYDDYIARLKQLPKMFDDTAIQMRKGMADGLMPPRFLLEKVSVQCERIAEQKPEETPFAQPLEKMPKSFSDSDRTRLRESMLSAIVHSVLPAYAKFAAFVKEEYAPRGRSEPGMWSLPDGAARYAAAVKTQTTTDLTPEQIHQIGLEQVALLEKQMLEIARKLGYSDLKSFNASIAKDSKLRAHSREEILDLYRKYIAQMKAELPKLFGRLPKADCIVMPVEAFREKEAAGAQYDQGTPDGKRPGHVMVNTSDPESRKTISMESTAYHEGVPGHHLQIAIAQELEDLPPQRQQAGYTAFMEGWALYSERLGKEVGFYQDPYNDYGRLQDEMLRAIRLVVDTGFHSKKWTRQQVVEFFHDHSAIDEVEVQSETDRYISDPGQALAYKIGQLKILELRERSKKELGDRFDIRKFHDTVLDAGALPLDVLSARVDSWVASERAGGGAAAK